jgi:hypothetical protein
MLLPLWTAAEGVVILKFGSISGLGLILGLLAVWWIEPQSTAGQGLVMVIVIAVVNGIGALLWNVVPPDR